MRNSPRLARNGHGYFEVRFNEKGAAKRQSLKTQDEGQAQTAFAHFLLRTQPAASYTVAQAWALRQTSLSGVVDQERIFNCWKALLPFFGPRDIESLQPKDFETYTTLRIAHGCVASTARRELVELRATFGDLVRNKKMKIDQIPVFELPPASAARPFFLTQEECTRVFAAAAARRSEPGVPTRLELFLHIGLGSGQRRRAIERLAWSQVDFATGMIHFAAEGEVVTRKRKASLPMSSALRTVLEAEYARRSTEWVLRMPGSIRTTFETLFAELGLSHCTPHTLRHTLISHLLMRGTPIFTVSKLIAVSVAQIERTYGHLTAAHMRAALEPC